MRHTATRRHLTCLATLSTLAISTFALSAPALADDGLSADGKGITLASGDLELNLGGRLHLDGMTYGDDQWSGTEADVRRARVEFSARLGDVVRLRVEREFAGVDGWRNVWAGVRPAEGVEIRGGNLTVPFSMEELQSSNRIPFVERSFVSALTPGFGLGGSVHVSADNWTLSGGYFGDALDDADGRARERGKGFAARATVTPMRSQGHFLHLGAAFEHRTFGITETPRFAAGPGSNLAPDLMQTNGITDAAKLDNFGAELAYARGPLQFQAQYVGSRIARRAAPTLAYGAWYAQASWMITGETYGYSRSGGIPTGPQLRKGKGAVELAARYSRIDLDDPGLERGTGSALSLGATWHVTGNVRLMANYVHARREGSLIAPDTTANLGVARLQFAF